MARILVASGVLMTVQLVLNGLAAGNIGVFDLAVEAVQVARQQAAVGLEFHVAARAQAAVIGLADLLGQSEGDFQGHLHVSLHFVNVHENSGPDTIWLTQPRPAAP